MSLYSWDALAKPGPICMTVLQSEPPAALRSTVSRPVAAIWPWFLVLLIVVSGVVLRVTLASSRPLWSDELFSWSNSAQWSYRNLLRLKSSETFHPTLSFILIKISMDLFRSNAPLVVRSTSLIAGLACIPFAFQLGRAVAGPKFGWVLAALSALDPLAVDQSAQARMFTLALAPALFALAKAIDSLQAIARGGKDTTRYGAVQVGLALAIGLWANVLVVTPWGAIVMAGCIIAAAPTAFGVAPPQVSNVRRAIWRFLWQLSAIGLIVLIPVVFKLVIRGWRHVEQDATLSLSAVEPALLHHLSRLISVGQTGPLPSALVWLFVLGGVLAVFRRNRVAGLVLLLSLLMGLFIAVPVGMVRSGSIGVRYFVLALPAMWAGLAGWMLLPGTRGRVIMTTLSLGLFVLQAFNSMAMVYKWKNDYEFRVLPAVTATRPLISPADQVLYFGIPAPEIVRYSGIQADDASKATAAEKPKVTWLMILRIKPKEEAPALAIIHRLGAEYGVATANIDVMAKRPENGLILRFSESRVDLLHFGADPRTGPVY
jgi:uncharacterized membrane protein